MVSLNPFPQSNVTGPLTWSTLLEARGGMGRTTHRRHITLKAGFPHRLPP